MGARVDRTPDAESARTIPWWLGGALGGAAGALPFGAVLSALAPETLRVAIPAVYGLAPGSIAGWLVHLAHGTALGALYAAFVRIERVDRLLDAATPLGDSVLPNAAIGLCYGVAIWAILPVVILPLWLGVVAIAEAGALTGFAPPLLLGHAPYGAVLGAVYGATVDR